MDAVIKKILPEMVINNLNSATAVITTLPPELWDEAVTYIISKLKKENSKIRGHFLFGEKFMCDLNAHIEELNKNSLYKITRN